MSNLTEDPTEWLTHLFSDEYCAECGGDTADHDAIPLLGNWFARCKTARLPQDSNSEALAWPSPDHSGGWVDAWNGWYVTFEDLMAEIPHWTAAEKDRTRQFGEPCVSEDEL